MKNHWWWMWWRCRCFITIAFKWHRGICHASHLETVCLILFANEGRQVFVVDEYLTIYGGWPPILRTRNYFLKLSIAKVRFLIPRRASSQSLTVRVDGAGFVWACLWPRIMVPRSPEEAAGVLFFNTSIHVTGGQLWETQSSRLC